MTRLTYIEKAKNNYKNGKKPNISRIIKHFMDLNASLASKSVYISKFKKELSNIRPDPILEKLKLPAKEAQEVWDKQQKAIQEKQIIKVKMTDIEKILAFKNSNDYYELTLYLVLVSGRREMELINLKPKSANDPNAFTFDQQLKKANPMAYTVPLYRISYEEFKKLIDKMNEIKPDLKQRTILEKLRAKLKFIMGDESIVIHNLRMIYAQLMYEESRRSLPVATYIQNVLGHENPSTSIHYNTLQIIN